MCVYTIILCSSDFLRLLLNMFCCHGDGRDFRPRSPTVNLCRWWWWAINRQCMYTGEQSMLLLAPTYKSLTLRKMNNNDISDTNGSG